MRRSDGFTLAELLIVVALAVLLAAIALPNLLRSQIAANETAAIESLAKINRAEVVYQTSFPTIGFTSTLEALGPGTAGKCEVKNSGHACLIEPALAKADSPGHTRSGYWFSVLPTSKDAGGVTTGYVASATAGILDKTGSREFCSEEDAVIRYSVPERSATPPASAGACRAMTILQ